MTRNEATVQIQNFFRDNGQDSPGLNAKGLGGAALGDAELYFEHDEQAQALACSALIYRFKEPPKPGVVEGFRAEQQAGVDTGGGSVDYEPENHGLYLRRSYQSTANTESFNHDMELLVNATRRWVAEVLPRVAAKVFHPTGS
jgi:hypothetical protein